jgi:hypothetical protein
MVLLATACSSHDDVANAPKTEVASKTVEEHDASPITKARHSTATVSTWAGRWLGPEGLFLDIRPVSSLPPATVSFTLKDNLDSETQYKGSVEGGTISFIRSGKRETIRPGTGAETGFKYLGDKKDCLIVQSYKEGYCR